MCIYYIPTLNLGAAYLFYSSLHLSQTGGVRLSEKTRPWQSYFAHDMCGLCHYLGHHVGLVVCTAEVKITTIFLQFLHRTLHTYYQV